MGNSEHIGWEKVPPKGGRLLTGANTIRFITHTKKLLSKKWTGVYVIHKHKLVPGEKEKKPKTKQSCTELSCQLPPVGNGHIDLSLLLFPYLQ